MSNQRERELTSKQTLESTDYIRVVGGQDGVSYRQLITDVAEYIIANYAGHTIGGTAQSVTTAIEKVVGGDNQNTKVWKTDAYGVPAWRTDANTTYNDVTTTTHGLMTAADKVKLNGIASGAQVNSLTGVKGNAESTYRTGKVNITPANVGAVPTTRKVNNKALSSDINLTNTDVGAAATSHTHSGYVPTSRTVNGKALTSNISLNASDVSAASSSHTHGDITNLGQPTTQVSIANGDKLMIADASDNNKIKSAASFDGSTTTQCLTKKGTFVSFPSTSHTHAGLVQIHDRTIISSQQLLAGEVLEALDKSVIAVDGYTPAGVAGFYATGSNNGHLHWSKCLISGGKLDLSVKNTHSASITVTLHVCVLYTKNS